MIIVGHRGARNEAPENTVESFVHANQNGCRHFELDVQLSADKQLVIFHDTWLKRTTGKRGALSGFTAEQLGQLDARRNTPGWPHPCAIPTLALLIRKLPNIDHWQFEVKTDSRFRLSIIADKLVLFIKQHHLAGRATITSSNRWFLREVKRRERDASTGLVAESRLYDPVKAATTLGCEYLCLSNKLVTKKRIARASEQQLLCSIWTVNDLQRMQALKSMGVHSVITDIPSLALKSQLNAE